MTDKTEAVKAANMLLMAAKNMAAEAHSVADRATAKSMGLRPGDAPTRRTQRRLLAQGRAARAGATAVEATAWLADVLCQGVKVELWTKIMSDGLTEAVAGAMSDATDAGAYFKTFRPKPKQQKEGE